LNRPDVGVRTGLFKISISAIAALFFFVKC